MLKMYNLVRKAFYRFIANNMPCETKCPFFL